MNGQLDIYASLAAGGAPPPATSGTPCPTCGRHLATLETLPVGQARGTDTDTAKAAAVTNLNGRRGEARNICQALASEGPANAYWLHVWTGSRSAASTGTRLGELARGGLVKRLTTKAVTTGSNAGYLWEITPAGLEALEANR